MSKRYWVGWGVVLFVLGLVLTIGSVMMSNVFSADVVLFDGSTQTFMTVGGQTLLLGVASMIAGVVSAIYGFVASMTYRDDKPVVMNPIVE